MSRGVAADLAAELTQEAWTRGWERRGQLRDRSAVAAWVNSIALNLLRAQVKVSSRITALAEREVEAAYDIGEKIDVAGLLRSCTAMERNVIRMFYFEGYTAREIAGQHGLTPSGVRVRLLRWRQRVRRKLGLDSAKS